MRKTKIICTMGPSTENPEIIRELIKAGMNVARLNFSHGTHEMHQQRIDDIKKLRAEMGLPVAILLDTKGPEIRTGLFDNSKITLNEGEFFTLTTKEITGNEKIVSVSCEILPKMLKKGDTVLIDDGLIELEVNEISEDSIKCIVKNGGNLSDRKSINVPGVHIDMPYMTEKDRNDILFGIKNDVDFIAASFARTKQDILEIRELLDSNGGQKIKIIAKIENGEGVENIEDILSVSNGIMIARGDLGVEIAFERLPSIQKKIIKKCYEAGKTAITATQMLDSMIHNPRPTRAEVTDVANAIYDGTSAIMLSGETAAGKYPVQSVEAMSKIVLETENDINYIGRFQKESVKNKSVTDAISHAACTTSIDLGAKAIVTVTQSGHTARMISKFRPSCNIIAATTDEKCYRQLALSWGVYPVMNLPKQTADELFESAVETAASTHFFSKGDILVVTGSGEIGVSGTTNLMRIFICE